MKKVLKILLVAILALSCGLSAMACANDNGEGSTKTGLLYKKVDGVYEVYKYKDDGKGVKELTIEIEGVTEGIRIKKNAFKDNSNLEKIIVSSSVSEIQAGAFANMQSLKTLELPFVGRYERADAYYKETGSASGSEKKAVNSERTIAHLFGTEEYTKGTLVNVNYGVETVACYMPETLSKIIINANGNYSIPMYAFNGVKNISDFVLNGNIVAIGESAFADSGVKTIELPATVTAIYKNAFANSSVKEVKLVKLAENNARISVKESAFSGCKSLSFVGDKDDVKANTIDLAFFTELSLNAFNTQVGVAEDLFKNYTILNKGLFDLEKAFGETYKS